jgi:hypothetical protein
MSDTVKLDRIVYISNEFAIRKDYISEQIAKLAKKLVDKVSLSQFEMFFVVLLVLRNEFVSYVTREYAISKINQLVKIEFQAHKSNSTTKLAFDFQNALFASYHQNASEKRKASKQFESKERFDEFISVQKTRSYTCHAYNVTDAIVKITKINSEKLLSFKVAKSFIAYIDAMIENENVKTIVSSVLK